MVKSEPPILLLRPVIGYSKGDNQMKKNSHVRTKQQDNCDVSAGFLIPAA